MAQSAVTIKDIAQRAGVSVTTVSRILNNKPDVSSETVVRVRAVMEDLGYNPQVSARRLASGRSSVIAVLPHSTSGELGSVTYEYLTGIVDAAEKEDFSVNLLPRSTSPEKLKALLNAGSFDGVVLLQVQTNDWRVSALKSSGKPFVLCGRTEDTAGISFVDLDLVTAAREMVGRVVRAGHPNVSFVANALSQKVRRFSASLLLEGYRSGMADIGLDEHVVEAEFSVDGIIEAIRRGVSERRSATCFFIGGHVAMPQILNGLRAAGIDVPADISLVSILSDAVAEITMPRITTIDLPGRDQGGHAARILVDAVLRRHEVRQELLIPRIVWRDSVRVMEGEPE